MKRSLPWFLLAFAASTEARAQPAAPHPASPSSGQAQPIPPSGPPDVPPPPETAPAATSLTEARPSTPAEPPLPGDEQFSEPEPGGPMQFVLEPPPPPIPRHVAPRTALWLGARVGWLSPFGSLYAQAVPVGNNYFERRSVDIRTYAKSGPMLELDVGARLARNYSLFAFWQRAKLGAGNGDDDAFIGHGRQRGGSSDFWGAGVRASSNADRLGFLTELAVGYRRARMEWEDDSAIEATHAFPEARFSLGVDIRVSSSFSLSPMASFGVGGFSKVRFVDAQGNVTKLIGPNGSSQDNHGWFELHIGGHFDLLGRN